MGATPRSAALAAGGIANATNTDTPAMPVHSRCLIERGGLGALRIARKIGEASPPI